MTCNIIILAAGKGSRMYSDTPKVLHKLAGKPMLGHVIDTAQALSPQQVVVVYGHGGDQVQREMAVYEGLDWAEQAEQLGTGHAVQQALPKIVPADVSLVLYGDVPLIKAQTLQALLDQAASGALAVLSVEPESPAGYGRIVKDSSGVVTAIVEEKDASDAQKAIREVNTGVMAIPGAHIEQWLGQLSNDNAQGEYYLTDLVAMASEQGVGVTSVVCADENEVAGVNNKVQLAALERHYQRQTAQDLLLAGATLADPNRIDVRGQLQVGRDVSIDVGCVFEGNVTLADGVRIGPYCQIRDSDIASGAQIEAYSSIDRASIGQAATVGPYARLREGTVLAENSKVGNFVETKKTHLGKGSKANHLSYIGDAEVGEAVNIGAGTITCNYDGVNKFKTTIGDRAFIGSNSSLVAPIDIGEGATVGAGSTVSKEAPEQQLTIGRAKQVTIRNWKRPEKK
ncbi:UDP-N-acetylglucosamine diphosphorylase/glucosamine-1-phosphate N-acetyltransferase [gamma proteobacterium HTCC5015]|nr:UDP-N-acetylglucosamine diphosphorylase/glucosamine-1-phosphate N-acetyltransferase [gamma proteobacterium HTCC5015]